MRILLLCAALFLTVLAGEAVSASPKYYAVIAACSRYENPKFNLPKFPAQPFSDKKLLVFHEALLQSENWREGTILVLLNDTATRENILNALAAMAGMVGPDDYFLFSWSGHGTEVIDADSDESMLDPDDMTDEAICPHDIARGDSTLNNVITDDELNRYFSAITCKGMTLIFDCCLSGGMVDAGSSAAAAAFSGRFARRIRQTASGDVNGGNRVVLMSTRPEYLERGIYLTGFPLVAGMAFACSHPQLSDTNNDGFVSAEESFSIAQPLVYAQSSFLWLGVWLASYAGYTQEPGSFFQSAIDTALTYAAVQLVIQALNQHYMGNFPIIADGYSGELPLIER